MSFRVRSGAGGALPTSHVCSSGSSQDAHYKQSREAKWGMAVGRQAYQSPEAQGPCLEPQPLSAPFPHVLSQPLATMVWEETVRLQESLETLVK